MQLLPMMRKSGSQAPGSFVVVELDVILPFHLHTYIARLAGKDGLTPQSKKVPTRPCVQYPNSYVITLMACRMPLSPTHRLPVYILIHLPIYTLTPRFLIITQHDLSLERE